MSKTRRILITGANKGIGLATVTAVLQAHDDTQVWLGSRDLARGTQARAKLIESQPAWAERLEVVQIDVSDDTSVARCAEDVAARGGLYGIVNNAGMGFGVVEMTSVLNVNVYGPHRVCTHFLPLVQPGGRVVNVSSAAGPNFVAECSSERQAMLTHPGVTWAQVVDLMDECLVIHGSGGDFASRGLGSGSAYGLSKACLNAYTLALARLHSNLRINACTPGFIETDLTRPFAEHQGVEPSAMGMLPPAKGTRAALHLLFGDVQSGWFFGSDALRSPMDRYREPGTPAYVAP